MTSDIETILTAFSGQWKTGIEERSIRMAHAVALQGDTATAQNILKFIAIPESMKMQILGAVISNTPALSVAAPVSDQPAAPVVRTMPEPLLTQGLSEGVPMAIPAVAESDLPPLVPVETPNPAFGTELGASTVVNAESLGVVNERPLPDTPIGSLPYERGQLFNRAFTAVQTEASTGTSRPMVKDADNIPIIHTYAEPEVSSRVTAENMSEQSQKGVKLFAALQAALVRAQMSEDVAVRASAAGQWDRLNNEFPDYQVLHRDEWNRMSLLVGDIRREKAPMPASDTLATQNDGVVASPPIETPPVVVTQSGSGYFGQKLKSTSEVLDEVGSGVAARADVTGNHAGEIFASGGYFAAKKSEDSSVVNNEVAELDSVVLSDDVTVVKNMTITGNSVFRIKKIYEDSSGAHIVFTDEIREYDVPGPDLLVALSDAQTKPDEFFIKYSK